MNFPSKMRCLSILFFLAFTASKSYAASALTETETNQNSNTESGTTTEAPPYNTMELAETFLLSHAERLKEKGFRSEINVGKIDPLLAEKKCTSQPTIELLRKPEEAEGINLRISCQAPAAWKLFLTANYKLFGPIVATTRPIPRGTIFEIDDFEIVEGQINAHRKPHYSDLVDLIGMLSKRPIKQGIAVSPHHITAPKLIERGDAVTIIASNHMISVRMQGTALTHGKKGQQITIKNNTSKRIVKAYVKDKGLVTIPL